MQVVSLWNLEKPLWSTGHMNCLLKEEEEFAKSREGKKKALTAEEQAKPQTQHAEFKKL